MELETSRPMSAAAEQIGESTELERAPAAGGAPGGVLVVDDDEDALEELVDILRGERIRSAGLRCSHQALEFLRAEQDIDVVISDVFMPRLGGIGLVGGIADGVPDRPWIRTILISGRPTPDLLRDAMRTAAVEFLPKPLRPQDLVDATRRALELAARTRGRFRSDPKHLPAGAGLAPALDGSAESVKDGAGAGLTFKAELMERIRGARHFDLARADVLGEQLVIMPAWDMLLDLLEGRLEGRRVSVSSLCLATTAPSTTALRRIDDLVRSGLAQRQPDPKDGRRVFIVLTDRGFDHLSGLLTSYRIDVRGAKPEGKR